MVTPPHCGISQLVEPLGVAMVRGTSEAEGT